MTGRRLSHYDVAEEISRGGMGIVYRATDVRLQRDVALKVLPGDLMHDADRRRRFIQEAQAASALEHPNIAVIHDVDEADGLTFIAMELIRGEKLSDEIARHRITPARTLAIAIDIASGLARAHERGIVHRDLKPANVMITADGNAKIIDFGIAKLLEAEAAGANAATMTRDDTAAGLVLGTRAYMSPEQTRGDRVDHRTDIFSFGVLLHEMISGQQPFTAPSDIETASAILHQPAPRLASLGPAVAPDAAAEIQRIVDKCLAKEPGDRYQGMRDAIVDLRGALRRIESTTGTQAAPPRPVSRRALVGGALAAVVIAILAVLWVNARRSNGSDTPATAGRGKPSVAVLYFDNASNTPDLEWMRTGITEMVVTDLSQSQDIEVVATEQIFDVLESLKRSEERVLTPEVVRAVAERTGVTNVIVGSYIKAGNTIRINVRLQEALSGRIISSERVEGGSEQHLFAMVDDLSRRLRAHFTTLRGGSLGNMGPRAPSAAADASDRGIVDVTTNSIDAYRHYAEGVRLHDRSREVEAAAMFEKAVAIDPAFAMAHAKLAVVHGNLGNLAERDRFAKLALQYSDRLTQSERYYIEGYAYSNSPRTLPRAMAAYEQCLEVDPAHYSCRHNLALRLQQLERREDAQRHYEELIRRGDSTPVLYSNLSLVYVSSGQPQRAVRLLDEYVRANPESAAGHEAHGFALMLNGELEAAVTSLKRAATFDPNDPSTRSMLAEAYVLREQWDAARKVAAELEGSPVPTSKWLGALAQHALALYRGDSAEALRAAERAVRAYAAPGQRSAAGRRNAAVVLIARRQFSGALAQAERAIAEARDTPAESALQLLRIQILAQMGSIEAAKTAAADLEASPPPVATPGHDRRVLQAKAMVALAEGRGVDAVAALERASLSLPPRSAVPGGSSHHTPIRFRLGEAYTAARRPQDAARAYQQIIDSQYERWAWPVEYVRSFYLLGQVQEQLGNRTAARDAYARFVKYWKDGDLDREWVANAIKKLSAP